MRIELIVAQETALWLLFSAHFATIMMTATAESQATCFVSSRTTSEFSPGGPYIEEEG